MLCEVVRCANIPVLTGGRLEGSNDVAGVGSEDRKKLSSSKDQGDTRMECGRLWFAAWGWCYLLQGWSDFTPHLTLAQSCRFVRSARLPLRNAHYLDQGVRVGANGMTSLAQSPLLY